MSNAMKIRARKLGEMVEMKVLMSHEMETGRRKTADGEPIPAHFIQHVKVTHEGRTVLEAQWGPAVAKNPYLAFKFAGGATGERVQINWTDSRGDTRTDEAIIG